METFVKHLQFNCIVPEAAVQKKF